MYLLPKLMSGHFDFPCFKGNATNTFNFSQLFVKNYISKPKTTCPLFFFFSFLTSLNSFVSIHTLEIIALGGVVKADSFMLKEFVYVDIMNY